MVSMFQDMKQEPPDINLLIDRLTWKILPTNFTNYSSFKKINYENIDDKREY